MSEWNEFTRFFFYRIVSDEKSRLQKNNVEWLTFRFWAACDGYEETRQHGKQRYGYARHHRRECILFVMHSYMTFSFL